ncbi:MAG: metalloregulator ArsR/SmtB family transcription factor [Pseudomonadota bacterium]
MPSTNNKVVFPDSDEIAHMLKALGHPVRLRMVCELICRDACCCGEMCDCFTLSQSTVSQHLSVLKEAGIVTSKADGTKSAFSIDRDTIRRLQDGLEIMFSGSGKCCDD